MPGSPQPINIQWPKTISEVMIRAFSYSWFTFNTLFYFRALYQIKGVKARFKRRTLHVPNLIYIFRSTQTIKFDC